MPRYLLVDDSRAIRVVLSDTLKRLQPAAVCDEAADGQEALRKFNEGAFDVVFLDLMMPGPVDGLAAMKKMLDVDPRTRVVVVTGLADGSPEVTAALSAGAAAYIRKPLSNDAVRRVLDKLVNETRPGGVIR